MNAAEVDRRLVAILLVVVVVGVAAFLVWQSAQPSDAECAIQHAEVEFGERASWQVDDACR